MEPEEIIIRENELENYIILSNLSTCFKYCFKQDNQFQLTDEKRYCLTNCSNLKSESINYLLQSIQQLNSNQQ